jgi:hypothetical protein
MAIGPVIGGYISSIDIKLTALISAFISVLSCLSILFLNDENQNEISEEKR